MSENYTPRVGDKVRATRGDAEVSGSVVELTSVGEVQIDLGVESWAMLAISDGWLFEQVVTVPSKFGAVIRRADGTEFTNSEPGALDGVTWFGRSTGWVSSAIATAGGFTVLFDGVDE